MGSDARLEVLDKYAVWIIKKKARQLVGCAGLTAHDREDLEQELILDLIRRLPKYDPARARKSTFIARVVEHKVATIIEARTAAKRDFRCCRKSLNERFKGKDGDSREVVECIDQEDYLERTGRLPRPALDARHLSMDVRKAVDQLPPRLRDICLRLATQSVSEISRETGIPRGTLYESIRKIQAVFKAAGLHEYFLPDAPTLSDPPR